MTEPADPAELRARRHEQEAIERLAEMVEAALSDPDRRVGTSLHLRRRGGDPHAARRAARDAALRQIARAISGLPAWACIIRAATKALHEPI